MTADGREGLTQRMPSRITQACTAQEIAAFAMLSLRIVEQTFKKRGLSSFPNEGMIGEVSACPSTFHILYPKW